MSVRVCECVCVSECACVCECVWVNVRVCEGVYHGSPRPPKHVPKRTSPPRGPVPHTCLMRHLRRMSNWRRQVEVVLMETAFTASPISGCSTSRNSVSHRLCSVSDESENTCRDA